MAYKLTVCSQHSFLTSLLRQSFRNGINIIKAFKRLQSTDAEAVSVALSDTFTTDSINNESIFKNQRTNMSNDMSPSTVWREFFKTNLINKTSHGDLQFKHLSINYINDYIMESKSDENDVYLNTLVIKCLESNVILSHSVIIKLLRMYSNKANIIMVTKLEKLYAQDEHVNKIKFNYYLGLAHWMKGNISEAFANFSIVFQGNYDSKVRMRKLLRILISNAIDNSSEATVVLIKKHSLQLFEDSNERSPLLAYWKACMFSKWYRDNQIAINLYNDNEKLRFYLDDSLYYCTSQALKLKKEDIVIDILQLLLKYNKHHQYSLIIEYLFDYRFRNGDLQGCLEVIKNCLTLKIQLRNHNDKCIKMLELYFKNDDLAQLLKCVDASLHTFNIKF